MAIWIVMGIRMPKLRPWTSWRQKEPGLSRKRQKKGSEKGVRTLFSSFSPKDSFRTEGEAIGSWVFVFNADGVVFSNHWNSRMEVAATFSTYWKNQSHFFLTLKKASETPAVRRISGCVGAAVGVGGEEVFLTSE